MTRTHTSNDQHLAGERIFLRPLVEQDFEQYKEVRERCHDWLSKWEPTVDGIPMDTTSTKEKFMTRVTAFERGSHFDTSYGFGIFLHDGTFIGEISLGTIIRGPFQSALMGYWVDEAYAGKGLVPEALYIVIGYAFSSLLFRRLEVAIIPKNHSSLRVVEKLGFEFEGVSKEYIEVNGVREDHCRYSMTPQLWKSVR